MEKIGCYHSDLILIRLVKICLSKSKMYELKFVIEMFQGRFGIWSVGHINKELADLHLALRLATCHC